MVLREAEDRHADGFEPRERSGEHEALARRSRQTVLVVDGDRDVRALLEATLGASLRVSAASDGEEGLARAIALRPDLVVTDIAMPKLTGDRMIHAIRAHRELEHVPVLVLSSVDDETLRVGMLRGGAQDYLVKPFSPAELRARVENLLAGKRERERLAAELARHAERAAGLGRDLVTAIRELSEAREAAQVARAASAAASRAKSSFLRLCSHELRTPLTTIRLQLEMFELEPEIPEVHRVRLNRLDSAAQRLQWLVDALLHHARLESSRIALSTRTFALDALLAETLAEVAPRAERRGLALELEAEATMLRSDPALVRTVVLHLVDNAIKFTNAGRVHVRAWRVAGAVHVEVSDTGLGIAPEERARIFDPFEQLEDVVHKHTPGVGLGLALVQRVIEGLHGQIELASEVGAGSTFTVTLPDLSPHDLAPSDVERDSG